MVKFNKYDEFYKLVNNKIAREYKPIIFDFMKAVQRNWFKRIKT